MLAELAKTSPVPIVLADEGEDAARVRDFLSQQNIPADAVLLDSGSSLSNALGSGVYPTPLFVAANGSITDWKSVVSGKRVSVRVDPGGRRIIPKKTHYTT